MVIFGTISGGASAALSGGNFWQGAVTGLVVSGLNHAMHKKVSEKVMQDESNQSNDDSGKVRFEEFTEDELKDYRVVPENGLNMDDLPIPANNITYNSDGFYFKNPTKDNYWFKIGDGKSVLVTPLRGTGRISFENRGLLFKVSILAYHSNFYNFFSDMGLRFKGEQDHWTSSPFKLKK